MRVVSEHLETKNPESTRQIHGLVRLKGPPPGPAATPGRQQKTPLVGRCGRQPGHWRFGAAGAPRQFRQTQPGD